MSQDLSEQPIGALFDDLAQEYDQLRRDVGWNPWPHLGAALGQGSLRGLQVLDLGCASGEVAQGMTDRGALVVGVDASEQMLTLARRRVPRARFILQDVREPLPLKDDSFDLTFALGCLEFVPNLEQVCQEMVRVTRPGGTLLYVVELCGPGLALGEQRQIRLYESWSRWRRTRAEVEATARALLDNPSFAVVPAYYEEEAQAQITYLRVIGQAPGRSPSDS